MTNDKRIAQQILNIFEKTPGFYRYGDETESKYVDLAICANTPEEGISSYATIGLFQTNIGLTYNEQELESCPQMNVSINTDDKEVFVTRLENEYALLALALEQVRKADGTPKYKREFIYQWLDNIREMGLRQAF